MLKGEEYSEKVKEGKSWLQECRGDRWNLQNYFTPLPQPKVNRINGERAGLKGALNDGPELTDRC